MLNEKEFQSQVTEVAVMLGWLVYHTHDSRRSPPGFPDLTLVRERVVFAELKVGKNKLTDDQVKWAKALRQAKGVEYYVWRPEDAIKLTDVLRRYEPEEDGECKS